MFDDCFQLHLLTEAKRTISVHNKIITNKLDVIE